MILRGSADSEGVIVLISGEAGLSEVARLGDANERIFRAVRLVNCMAVTRLTHRGGKSGIHEHGFMQLLQYRM